MHKSHFATEGLPLLAHIQEILIVFSQRTEQSTLKHGRVICYNTDPLK